MEAVKWRRSIRRYRPDPVPREALLTILEAARLSPSGSNSQPWRFIVITELQEKRKLRELTLGMKWLEEAPVVILCCADLNAFEPDLRRTRNEELLSIGVYEDFEGTAFLQSVQANREVRPERTAAIRSAMMNTAIAIQSMVLTAASLGLGTCWMGGFEGTKARQMFDRPDNIITVALIPLGYPAQSPAPRPRLKLDQILLRPLPAME